MAQRPIFAHSLVGQSPGTWEPLSSHLTAVGLRAAAFARQFGAEEAGAVVGRLHDIGKVSAEFQAYIGGNGSARGPDHSTAGAREAVKLFGSSAGKMLAFCIAGHHAGLADGGGMDPGTLEHRLSNDYAIKGYAGWEEHADLQLKKMTTPDPLKIKSEYRGFEKAFFIRMLFSALVDADFLETERFYFEASGERMRRGPQNTLEVLRSRLDSRLCGFTAAGGDVNRLRGDVLKHVRQQAKLPTGLFSLTVPTGGGKTLTSLAFALDHAIHHGLERIIYVIPYTSIIEQTADIFRNVLGGGDDILEHHSAVDWGAGDQAGADGATDDEGREGLKKLRRDAENWDVRIVVTTAVQFFESLYAARTSACRKLHNIARSVIVLDEAQTLPLNLLLPCMAAIDTLAKGYGASVVLCTATQPALSKQDGFPNGLEHVRELAPDPRQLYTRLKRVRVVVEPEPVDDMGLAARMRDSERILCIVNSRAHARDVFAMIKDEAGARHLTTVMCPLHRRAALADIRGCLKDRKPVRLIATSLIEAGVDVDFPVVWRAITGLDSIAQAAGRCNREGVLAEGMVHVFQAAVVEGRKAPQAVEQLASATREILRLHAHDPLGLDAITAYFQLVYWKKGSGELDRAPHEGRDVQILQEIADNASKLTIPFAAIARAFRFIPDSMAPVIVPYRQAGESEPVEFLVKRLEYVDRPGALARKLALYSVPVPRRARGTLLAQGAARIVQPEKYGDRFVVLENSDLYSSVSGLDWADPSFRSAEANIM
jgi:CRISPR-associated endonuclease/helicase Cas3